MQKISVYFNNPRRAIFGLVQGTSRLWPDKLYISILYRLRFRRKMNWNNPTTFCEKMNWMKLYNRDPKYTQLADKYAVKQYVSDCIGDEYVVENYTIVEKWNEINFDRLPNQFVIKCTHDSGGAYVCRDKNKFNFEKTRLIIECNLKKNYYYHRREWPYKNIKPRIIVDRFLDDHTGQELRDYKWWCFNGKPKYMYLTIKGKNVYENFYDMDFRPVAIDHGYPRHQPEFEKPTQFELMKTLATELSKGIPFVRIDFFQVEGKVYFGEFTFYDWGGIHPFKDEKTDRMLGDLLVLPTK